MADKPRKDFAHWFVNVFWYHYGKLALALLAALAVALWLTLDALQKKEYDLNAAVAIDGQIAPQDTERLSALLAEAVGDVNGDGETLVNLQTVDMSGVSSLDDNRLMLYVSLPEYTLFFLDEKHSAAYCAQEDTFQPLEDYGIEPDVPGGKRVYVGDRLVMRYMGPFAFYACLSDWTVDGKGDADMTAAAVRALRAVLTSEEYEGAAVTEQPLS